ncbi:HD domain-containing protein [Desulfohalobiaceae bacterium Ax17]|jgi:HD-GYP domain-containing protein (c-di-GMP phosphodiesterase class II)|uniref:HD-GYP domain-containing protein n=1 Tax=Desulfovulcanus ferrireducens TaxID=2831190 RepID=UPI00207B9DEC|nr:HD domain-containing protein [Desulfovulcanus ferrireducens]MBT8763650.1 HD domain-containing protein [Desulfovulcanus ferrireducens]
MIKEPQIDLFDLIISLSKAMDLVSPAVVNHHMQVAYIAVNIATEMNLPPEEQRNLMLAGALHDSGAISMKDKMDALHFEFENPHQHAELGYLLLKKFTPLSQTANLVRFHHVPWNYGGGAEFNGIEVPIGSHIIHLADRVAVTVNKEQEILGQVERITKLIKKHSGKLFAPDTVDAFESLSAKEYFWLDITSSSISTTLRRQVKTDPVSLGPELLLGLSKLFSRIIDFRSRFTATHSSGVAASAEALARLAGFSKRECLMMRVAGYLHDLGKLAVPPEILEKPGKLTKEEFAIIRSHTFYTYRCLEPITELEIINSWASFHHERLDGKGYPFHHKGEDLSLGARIMAVADVFTAITEDRPYRKGMSIDRALQILDQMANSSILDPYIVSLLKAHCDEVNDLRKTAQIKAIEEYQRFSATSKALV